MLNVFRRLLYGFLCLFLRRCVPRTLKRPEYERAEDVCEWVAGLQAEPAIDMSLDSAGTQRTLFC